MKFTKIFSKKKEINSAKYWEERYQQGGTSGVGSYNELALFKADFLNDFVERNTIKSVIEFGCGDGNQLSLAKYAAYIGLDVSPTVLKKVIDDFQNDQSKSFFLYNPTCFFDNSNVFSSDLTLSLDVIYHLVEDEMYQKYMHHLFSCSKQYTVIYSTNTDDNTGTSDHVRHRHFTHWVSRNMAGWILSEELDNQYPNLSSAKFYVYRKL